MSAASRMIVAAGAVLLAANAALGHSPSAEDHNTTIELMRGGGAAICYEVWWGSLCGMYICSTEVDSNEDHRLSAEEKETFRKYRSEQYAEALSLILDGAPAKLEFERSEFECEGEKCIPMTIILRLHLRCGNPSGRMPKEIEFRDDAEAPLGMIGNNTVLLKVPPDFEVTGKKPRTPRWSEQYITGGTFVVSARQKGAGHGGEQPGTAGEGGGPASLGDPAGGMTPPAGAVDPFESLVDGFLKGGGGISAVFAALFVSFWLGAVHALSPGHGKAMVAGYLVGSRGRLRDAVFLGLIVTATHISSVVAIGILMLSLSRVFRQDRVFPWMTIASGLLVSIIGVSIFLRFRKGGRHPVHEAEHGWRIWRHSHEFPQGHGSAHDHEHAHDGGLAHGHGHEPICDPGESPEGRPGESHAPTSGGGDCESLAAGSGHASGPAGPRRGPGRKDLLMLGLSGGMVPCPSALAVLLISIAFDAAHVGLLLIASFSLGLASVLVGIGVAVVYAGKAASGAGIAGGRVARALPLVSGTAVTLAGMLAVLKGISMLGIVDLSGWSGLLK